jgi:hypothetical protein
MGSLGMDTPWDELDGGLLQELIELPPKQRGVRFAALLRNECQDLIGEFFKETGEFTIQIPALKRPTLEELQENNPRIISIERDISPEGPVTLKLGTVLGVGKKPISGEKYERRLALIPDTPLGWQQLSWLVAHQDDPELKSFKAFVWRYYYIDFLGLVVIHGVHRVVPFAVMGSKRWDRCWHDLDGGFNSKGRLALSSK